MFISDPKLRWPKIDDFFFLENGTLRNYSEEDLENAVQSANLLGQRAASRLHHVPLSTLQRKLASGNAEFTKRGVKPVLNKEVEDELVSAIITFKNVGFGLIRKDVSTYYFDKC